MRYSLVVLVTFLVLLASCSEKNKTEQEIEKIAVDLTINRFDKVFDQATVADLPNLKRDYPLFFPVQYPDSIWIHRLQDTLQQQLHDAVSAEFPDETQLEDDLSGLFQHIKYYFPEFREPTVYTTTSDVDYQNRVIMSDSLLVLSLDCYLGADHPFYDFIPAYIGKNLNASHIVTDVAATCSRQFISPPRSRTLLAQMIYYGKELYLKDIWLPEATDGEKIGYTEEEIEWAEANEVDIWRYFIENESLYSTETKLQPRFINPAPFSKFYLEIDNESPGMIGRFVGWQIVRAYMKNNPVNVKQLMIAEADDIFNNSKYKPNK